MTQAQPPARSPADAGTAPGHAPGPGWGEPRTRSVTWYDPAATVAGGAGLSGLEFLRALRDGRLAPPPIALLLNMTLRRVERGLVVFDCQPDESVYNPIGLVHGGLVCTLTDSAIGCAVQTTLEAGVGYTSIDITVNYLRPVTLDSGGLVATGRVVRPGRRVAQGAAQVHDGAGRLVATASSNCLIIGAGELPGWRRPPAVAPPATITMPPGPPTVAAAAAAAANHGVTHLRRHGNPAA